MAAPITNASSRAAAAASAVVADSPDLVFVRDLFVKALTGVDAWHRPEPQPVNISIFLRTSVAKAGSTDHLTYSLNYAVITRKVTKMVETTRFKSLEDIAEKVAKVVLSDSIGGQWAKIKVRKPRALLRADASEIEITRIRVDKPFSRTPSSHSIPTSRIASFTNLKAQDGDETSSVRSSSVDSFEVVQVPGSVDTVRIHNLRLVTIIGVNTIERLHKQNVILGLTLYKTSESFGVNKVSTPGFDKAYDFRAVVQRVSDHVEDSSYKTVEAFVTSVAQVVCEAGVWKVTVRAEKPSALTFADAAGVEVTRTKEYFEEPEAIEKATESEKNTPSEKLAQKDSGSKQLFPDSKAIFESDQKIDDGKEHIVYIAFGSNIGPSLSSISSSVEELAKRGVNVISTSGIYESEPMYVKDQPKFYNGVFKATTVLSPLNLLSALKDIEYQTFGRVKLQENGPRSIDLDILLYEDWVVNKPTLVIPHVSMLDRNFVLRPLKDVTSPQDVHPLTAEPYHSHLDQLLATKAEENVQESLTLRNVVPLRPLPEEFICSQDENGDQRDRKVVFDADSHTVKTHVMAILNVTPDSFSDGGRFASTKLSSDSINIDTEAVADEAVEAVNAGVTILDIGGMSTRPGAKDSDVTVEEEIKRTVPAIKAIRAKFAALSKSSSSAEEKQKYQNVIISIDTYRSQVAEATIKAGADIINDISGGLYDPEMFNVAKTLGVPIVINHTRGTPDTMNSPEFNRYEWVDELNGGSEIEVDTDSAIINVVRNELAERVQVALDSGLKRWQIILDPGIGFAKNIDQNLAIIRNFKVLRTGHGLVENGAAFADGYLSDSAAQISGFPWLVGSSRKRFIGTLTGKSGKGSSAKDRVLGTAATVTALIGEGADIVRIHDVEEMTDVAKVSDAIYRGVKWE